MRPSLRPPWPIQTQLLRWHPRAPQSIPRRIATTSAANAAPIDVPNLILSPGSKHHNSLPSFLEHAKRMKLNTEAPTFVGTHYEYTTALSLLRLGFSLLRVGAKNDAGIDLIGHWVLAPLQEPLRVIIQCKARNISVSPCHVRDLEGSLSGVPASWKNHDVLGLLITTNKATKGTLKALGESRRPMGFVMVSQDGVIQQFVWNRAAAERGLEGVGVTLRHTPRALLAEKQEDVDTKGFKTTSKLEKFKNAGTKKDIQLTWMGTPIFPERDTLDNDTLNLMRLVTPKTRASNKKEKKTTRTLKETTIPMALREPMPRGGMVTGKSGRPKGSTNAVRLLAKPRTVTSAERGRPKGSETAKQGRGRPKGSKNKPKPGIEAG
jgi:hypothetical protein